VADKTRLRKRSPGLLVVALSAVVVVGLALGGGVAIGRGSRPGVRPRSGAHRGTGSGGGAVALTASERASAESGATVTVTGTGVVEGNPNTVTIELGVTTNAASATGALAANDQQISRVTALLGRSGVLPRDIETSGLSLGQQTNNAGVVTGYSANDTLTITVTGIARAGVIIDAAAQVVGNAIQLDGVTFSIANTSPLLREARAAALDDARLEAGQLAAGIGAVLGPVVKIVDESESSPPEPFFGGVHAGSAAALVPLSGGSQQLSVEVQVVYALRP